MEIVHRFRELFEGRTDAWGADMGRAVREPVQYATWTKHLLRGECIGIYPLRDDLHVKWGCVDIDIPLASMPTNLFNTLVALKIPAWIERSRSKGHHVWVFAEAWVPATLMRDALLVACQVADVPPKEVNPKQTHLEAGGLGNYVRLPYVGALGPTSVRELHGGRQVMVTPDHASIVPFYTFVENAYRLRVTADRLAAAANLLAPPPPVREVKIIEPSRLDKKSIPRLAQVILDGGPLDGADRSGTLLKLAVVLRDGGVTPGEALGFVRDADQRWGKFHKRADGEEQMRRLIERVYR